MVEEPVDADERARTHLTNFQKFLIQTSRHRGGKVGLALIYAAFGLPFFFNVFVLVLVTFTIYPLTSGVTEKMAVLGFLFLVLNAVAYQVRGVANSVLTVMFLTRRRRRPRKVEPPSVELK